ncbi:MAG: hypothetical protein ACJ8MR_11335 [Povalibacter sp.]
MDTWLASARLEVEAADVLLTRHHDASDTHLPVILRINGDPNDEVS